MDRHHAHEPRIVRRGASDRRPGSSRLLSQIDERLTGGDPVGGQPVVGLEAPKRSLGVRPIDPVNRSERIARARERPLEGAHERRTALLSPCAGEQHQAGAREGGHGLAPCDAVRLEAAVQLELPGRRLG